ncbi:MAG TPA: EF2563 family selenium-dependent molybdenum hydroxylase system protein [Desulfobacteraceae bacterium]|nr:EF2563 family selenium-dependent molybdenum hydroxylase system protein [Desulfobacteraceae bacterium]
MVQRPFCELIVGIKGAGDLATGLACRLYGAKIHKIFMMEVPRPLAVRRGVAFCETVYDGKKKVEDVEADLVTDVDGIHEAWEAAKIPVVVDPQWIFVSKMIPDVVIDAIIAKDNLGTTMGEAPLVIGMGPGFVAGEDVHMVIETNRGHNLGRIISSGSAESNTGAPGNIAGFTVERVLRSPSSGIFASQQRIGDVVKKGNIIGDVNGKEVKAGLDGVIRGLIRSGVQVTEGLKLGDVDPRGDESYCYSISDKSRCLGGAVLEAILRVYNT